MSEEIVEINRASPRGGPTPVEVMREIFKDLGQPDDVYWVLMKHGTFYTFNKRECGPNVDKQLLVEQALQLSQDAALVNHDGNDTVQVFSYQDLWSHPTYLVLSCLRQKIGWVVIAEGNKWAETEQESAAVGLVARTRYELDCQESTIVATSW